MWTLKAWFDINVLNTIQIRNKHYKKWSSKEIDKDNLKQAEFLLKNIYSMVWDAVL